MNAPFDVRSAVKEMLASKHSEDACWFDGHWRNWAWIANFHQKLAEIVERCGLEPGHAIGLVARNRAPHLAAMAAQTAAGRLTSMIYSAQSAEKIAEDILSASAPIVLADREDWTEQALAAARMAGTVAVQIGDGETPAVEVLTNLKPDLGTFRRRDSEIGFEMLSSGTTGAPKRVPLAWSTLSSATSDAKAAYAGTAESDAPQIMLHPLGNIAGVSYLLPIFAFGQRVVLMEKFEANAWIDVIRTFRPVRAALPAAGVRMILDSPAKQEDLASLSVLAVGGGKLDVDVQIAFEERFGIPVLTAFGATEFAGVIANWTLEAYRQFAESKRGSAGRASPNVQLRIVNRDTLQPLPVGEVGLLEARVDRLGDEWIRTNDLASLDQDGFLFIHGRADGAINRGGFKIVPDVVVAALKQHPSVSDAAVVAMSDHRLGEVPVAAVELLPGCTAQPDELVAFLRERLVAYQVPVEIRIVQSLPRNPSMKVAAAEVKAMFDR